MVRKTVLACLLGAVASPAAWADPATYATPQEALEAFAAALVAPGTDALLEVFGPDAADVLSTGNPVEDRLNRTGIIALVAEGYRMIPEADGAVTLALGADGWPFPIPVARGEAGWSFDIDAGRLEIEAREIGHNELDVIALMDAYVDVQAAFRLTDHDGDGVMEFAGSIISSEEARDGLFWPGPGSPLGALFARAALSGYSDGETDHAPDPFSGYYFRILDAQGPNAPGGALDYRVGGNMVAGHALLAVPATYAETGVHSFMVSENGVILEADLGEDSLTIADAITVYDPGPEWSPVD
ncbi:DUF2950 family protein [Tropicimonas sp. S265A]|uniref:DUF2950 family protein n=1 Tax=Tropicimonas sp. S265A TaxID=3415134 RepID=UPI003C7E081B